MAALRNIRSRQEVNKFCSIGSDLLSGPPCLSFKRWEAALETLEKAKHDTAILPTVASLSVHSACESVRHYHNIYYKCVQLTVIPLSRWRQWREGLCFFMGDSSSAEAGPLATLCRQLFVSQQECYAVAFWGCWRSVGARLESHLASLAADTASEVDDGVSGVYGSGGPLLEEEEKGSTEDVDLSLVRLRRRCFSALYEFQRLAHDAAHLFDSYAMVGRSERQWLTDTFLLEQDEKAAEALVRRSFKRDFGVPSIDLEGGGLLDEYHSFEVNEGKTRTLEKKAQDTLKGVWCRKALDLFEYEMKRHRGGTSDADLYDAAGNKLCDLLFRCLHEKEGRPDLAFALTMRRILDNEPFPATVDLARVGVALRLFLQWFEKYTHRRQQGDIPLFLDPDLWTFVLERHTELLKWVLFHYCHDETAADVMSALKAVKAVCFSVQQCLGVYLTAVASRRLSSDVKQQLEGEAKKKVCDWVQYTAVNTFLSGIQHLCCEAAAGTTAATASTPMCALTPALLAVQTDVSKVQLLLLCDAVSFAMDARRILLPALERGFTQMHQLAGDTNTAILSHWTMCMLSLLSCLCRSLCRLKDGTVTAEDLVLALHSHYRELRRLSPAFMADLVTDAWIDFLLGEGRGALGTRHVGLVDLEQGCHAHCNCHCTVEGTGKKAGQKRSHGE
ncbi:hypothetical protein TraAM80_04054 [Trypanosoma rangeli]|uniref:Uncharacterized protein n=1 Tax=Trypanosoma rangeli TaxID=5698 RepID=A0A422NL86_TRYRA|nr:uncharacterized protein TraAM80_04054 [Trypanosoma rangeli]RNF06231.1 hypothetical protein TraAM80_04054 [Trypanosoma rangeli]|eukprot:RNF06231.1 hypothetical protein TraAM80_04054 [Trypanosoma rangeli]